MNRKPYAQLSDIIHKVFSETDTTGAIAITGSVDEIYFMKSFGTVHCSSHYPVSNSTYFDIQSITKVVGTINLLEIFLNLNKINLNDRIQKFIPEFQKNNKSEISIRDLVLHQSGISDEDFGGRYNSPEELWNSMLQAPTRFNPGEAVEYTDVGYRILGLCLERLGNNNLAALCKEFVWDPLGMNNTTYDISRIEKNLVAGGRNSWCILDDAQDRFLNQSLGCDGVFTIGDDLVKFCRNWLKKLSKKEYRSSLYRSAAGFFDKNWTCYESLGHGRKVFGWEQHDTKQSYIGSLKTELTLEKAGGAGTFICIRPEQQDFFIYLTNHGRPDPFSMNSWNQLIVNLRVKEVALEVML